MPELPEVENVRRTLAEHIVGRRIAGVTVHRPDVVTGQALPEALLAGQRLVEVLRHGKQLAIVSDAGRCVCIHLGMTGRLTAAPAPGSSPLPTHTHVVWQLESGCELRFIDPRRFGGLWTFHSLDELRLQRWDRLGEDALALRPRKLYNGLRRTHRPLKATLLDQTLIAGLGNIYVDELLFTCRLHPARPADTLPPEVVRRMVRNMRALLTRAIAAGGSTLRDYADANGTAGNYQLRHRVYGRGGQPCVRCRRTLGVSLVAGRTTVMCNHCQPA